ncbi:CTD nuclear envelope phosphatase 1 homolog [Selaginella moellendorffii]|uniref:CTD nuclear envelope phosphatase 1 homolog n=1 Tax=Selaginella moellendorffii TaxID=88036 RepID=UPI000D1CDCBE|nr:CTD nuclear envelope phosphatase 1 homolog [Selaginella moellendorffii]|eukprot:XP_024524830.1 CTD nuclear envelope phosphatase 1 homolog [Selaginella moellendorffii]
MGKPTLVLDLDGTLICARRLKNSSGMGADMVVEGYAVYKRPGLDKFLRDMAKLYEIVIFSYNYEPYVNGIADKLDPTGTLISQRLSRESCPTRSKDLSAQAFGRDLARVVWLDDTETAFDKQPGNGLVVPNFMVEMSNGKDSLFEDLRPHLDAIVANCGEVDVPSALQKIGRIQVRSASGKPWVVRVNQRPERINI